MIFKLFQENGNIRKYLSHRSGMIDSLSLDFDAAIVDEVEEIIPGMQSGLSFLGSISIPTKVVILSIPVRGDVNLLFYSPTKGYLLRCFDGIFEDSQLIIRTTGDDSTYLLNYLHELQEQINKEVMEHNAALGQP